MIPRGARRRVKSLVTCCANRRIKTAILYDTHTHSRLTHSRGSSMLSVERRGVEPECKQSCRNMNPEPRNRRQRRRAYLQCRRAYLHYHLCNITHLVCRSVQSARIIRNDIFRYRFNGMGHILSVLETDGYVVGSNNGPSGLHVQDNGVWQHRGWRNVRAFSVAVDDSAKAILLACGNGLLRSLDAGQSWRVESDWRVTEVLDVLPGPHAGGALLATAHGVWQWAPESDDAWRPINDGLDSTFVSQLVRLNSGYAAATETGVYTLRTAPGGKRTWKRVGVTSPARSITVSHGDRRWIVGLEKRGIARSSDGGTTWTYPLASDSIYATASHPIDENTLVAGGLSGTLWLSTDGGVSWQNVGTPGGGDAIHSLAFESEDSPIALCGCGKTGLHRYDPTNENHLGHALERAFISKILTHEQA